MDFRNCDDGSASGPPVAERAERQRQRPSGLGALRLSSTWTIWAGFPLEAHYAGENGYIARHAVPYPLVVVCTAGRARVRVEAGGTGQRFTLEQGKVCIVPGGGDIESRSWSGSHEMVAVELRPCGLNHPLANDSYLADLRLAARYAFADPQVVALLANMRAEIEAGCPSSRLYGETLSLALITYLAHRYSAGRPETTPRAVKLSAAQFALVRDHIRTRLSEELDLAELAAVVHLSPHHFCFLFKNAAGITPHQYVLRERIHEGMRRLAARRSSIAEVAGALGFANQSHFTAVFGKVTGTTPKRYRQSLTDWRGHDAQRPVCCDLSE